MRLTSWIFQSIRKVVPDFEVIFIDPCWQKSLEDYNKLKISIFFYELFKEFEFLITYELDAWVFRDEVEYWCKKDYDYIGAPWTDFCHYKGEILEGVGNSGFSLRKVTSCINSLRSLRILRVLDQYKNFNWKGMLARLPKLSGQLVGAFSETEIKLDLHEDIFWCKVLPSYLNNRKYNSKLIQFLSTVLVRNKYIIALKDVAMQFSFETEAENFFKLNNEKLPFGCHAWEKYEPVFWKEFILIHQLVRQEKAQADVITEEVKDIKVSRMGRVKSFLRRLPLVGTITDGFQKTPVASSNVIKGLNNEIINNGNSKNVTVDIDGDNNQIVIGANTYIKDALIYLRGDNHKVIIEENCHFGGGELWIEDNNCSIIIHAKTTIETWAPGSH